MALSFYNQVLIQIDNHINELKKSYNLKNDDSEHLRFHKLIAHKIFTEQQAGRLEKMFYYLIRNNPFHIITEFENTNYPTNYIPMIISMYINQFYSKHTELINKLILLNQYHLEKYKKSWKYLNNEDDKFFENFYEIIYKIENVNNNEQLQELITEINKI